MEQLHWHEGTLSRHRTSWHGSTHSGHMTAASFSFRGVQVFCVLCAEGTGR